MCVYASRPYDPTNDLLFKFVFGREERKSITLQLINEYKNKPVQSMDRIEKWLAYFANKLDEKEKEELAMKDTAIKDAMQASDRYIMDDAAYREYIARESAIWDYNSDLKANLAEGRAEGRAQEQERTALDMLRDNMDISLIMKYTKLSAERIAELAKTI